MDHCANVQLNSILPKVRIVGWLCLIVILSSSCYVFRKKGTSNERDRGQTASVLGESLGARAGGLNTTALQNVYDVPTTHSPAGVRPDPDLFVRQLLLEYREQGSVVAREIGRVEAFRLLLGGANQNFTIVPQETYDATSLLAELKVAEELCRALVSPNASLHPGWATILPAPAADSDTNIRFLAQRLLGVPSSSIEETTLNSLKQIYATSNATQNSFDDYIPVCATLILDAEALLL